MNQKWQAFFEDFTYNIIQFLKSQLIISALTFIILCMGLRHFEIPFWGLIAAAITLFDLIPVLGSGMIMVPWAIIRAFSLSIKAGGQIAILYMVLVVIRSLVEPILTGSRIGIHPLLLLLASLAGAIALGPMGAIVGALLLMGAKSYSKIILHDQDSKNRSQAKKDRIRSEFDQ